MHSVVNVQNQFVNFASFRYRFGQTHNNNRETLCSRVCAFAFCINSLHQFVMLGPKQLYHKSIAQRRLGSSQRRIVGRTIEELSTGQFGSPCRVHVFWPVLAIIMLKFRTVLNKRNLSYQNC